jgi:hypothetical protein
MVAHLSRFAPHVSSDLGSAPPAGLDRNLGHNSFQLELANRGFDLRWRPWNRFRQKNSRYLFPSGVHKSLELWGAFQLKARRL